eukprot:Unigene6213_Nuclearia_a/m.19135 Unigene6213_Nuclearia_a/g.19135  ORF Unigene6213_Nuclearia_a/g.19135 Unigene6213_Nuclearia_a/m.19135 type:complete len:324 (-) Unigene6213_Nuclearia_a:136-1107(-)
MGRRGLWRRVCCHNAGRAGRAQLQPQRALRQGARRRLRQHHHLLGATVLVHDDDDAADRPADGGVPVAVRPVDAVALDRQHCHAVLGDVLAVVAPRRHPHPAQAAHDAAPAHPPARAVDAVPGLLRRHHRLARARAVFCQRLGGPVLPAQALLLRHVCPRHPPRRGCLCARVPPAPRANAHLQRVLGHVHRHLVVHRLHSCVWAAGRAQLPLRALGPRGDDPRVHVLAQRILLGPLRLDRVQRHLQARRRSQGVPGRCQQPTHRRGHTPDRGGQQTQVVHAPPPPVVPPVQEQDERRPAGVVRRQLRPVQRVADTSHAVHPTP